MDKKLLFAIVFGLVSLVALNINVSYIQGSQNKSFKLFQLVAPTAGAFLGPVLGTLAAFVAEVLDALFNSKELTFSSFLFMFPVLGAVYYFSAYAKSRATNDILTTVIPLMAITAFVLHPVGSAAAIYSAFWLIPLIVKLLPENVFLRSLGATFTAHAIGSVFWIYLFATTPSFWFALIPLVMLERLTFAFGITASFLAFNNILGLAEVRFKSFNGMFSTEKNYLYFKN